MTTRPVVRSAKAPKPVDLRLALRSKPDQFVMCMGLRHAWAIENDFFVTADYQVGKKVKNLSRTLVCMRCEARRHERYLVHASGLEKTNQYITYPAGYNMPGVPRGVKPSWIIQQEQYRRALERAAHAQPGERETAER